jgi:hypothetical protein
MKKLLYLLSFASFLSYFSISIGKLNANYDQVLIILLSGIFFVDRFFMNRGVYIDKPGLLLIGLMLLSAFSSAFLAPDPKYSLLQTINLFSVSLIYFIIPNVLRTYDDIQGFLKVHLRLAEIWLVVSIIAFLYSYTRQTEIFGVNLMQNEHDPFGVYATMLEPNIFGSFMLVVFTLSFALYMSGTYLAGVSPAELRNIMILSTVGIFVSFTRGVWLGAVAAVALYYIINSKSPVRSFYQIVGVALLGALVLYVLAEVLKIEIVRYKLENFFSTTRGTGITRRLIWQSALQNWVYQGNLFLGNGTYSYATFFNKGGYVGYGNAWIGNIVLTFLHDTGIIGLGIFLLYYAGLTKYTLSYNRFRILENFKFIRNFSIGFFISLAAVFIAFFFTTGLSFAYGWILFGLIAAMNRINQAKKRELLNGKSMAVR